MPTQDGHQGFSRQHGTRSPILPNGSPADLARVPMQCGCWSIAQMFVRPLISARPQGFSLHRDPKCVRYFSGDANCGGTDIATVCGCSVPVPLPPGQVPLLAHQHPAEGRAPPPESAWMPRPVVNQLIQRFSGNGEPRP